MAKLDQGAAIEVDHLAEARQRPVGELAGEAEAGIVDQRADAEPFGAELGDQACRRAVSGEVGFEDMDPAADLAGERLHPVAAPRDERQLLAARRALAGEFGAEARRGAGDQGDLPRHQSRNDALTIRPGSRGGSPLGRASTCSMPSSTSPQTVYWPSRKRESSKQMKNWLLALFGFCERAIDAVPRTCGSRENSAARLGLSDPPMPL